jgi:hypothetical protein
MAEISQQTCHQMTNADIVHAVPGPPETLELRLRKMIGVSRQTAERAMTRNMTRTRLRHHVAGAVSAMLACTAAIFSAAHHWAG